MLRLCALLGLLASVLAHEYVLNAPEKEDFDVYEEHDEEHGKFETIHFFIHTMTRLHNCHQHLFHYR